MNSLKLGAHPGNSNGFTPIIDNFAGSATGDVHDQVKLIYPMSHSMKRWEDNKKYLTFVGRLHDLVDFKELPTSVQSPGMAAFLGASEADKPAPEHPTMDVCGSPGEVESKPELGHQYSMYLTDELKDDFQTDIKVGNRRMFKQMNFYSTVLTAPDQLRQRMAWALSQILVIGEEGLGNPENLEYFTVYRDLFVKHAFGNYRDLLKEVSWSPVMGEYLTYRGNRGYHASGSPPDENYAREIMQLFSIGLWELRLDGTPKIEDGTMHDMSPEFIATYENEHVETFARIWTGFDRETYRGNIEARYGERDANRIDPMQIKPTNRDHSPKKNLYSGYIGDGVPLCADLPPKSYARKGATYRYLGESPFPKLNEADDDWWIEQKEERGGSFHRLEIKSVLPAITNSFESDMDGWTTGNVATSDQPFTRTCSGTPSGSTGPASAAHPGACYVFAEVSNQYSKVFELEKTFPAGSDLSKISFQYHMYGIEMGSAVLESSSDGVTWVSLWSQTGEPYQPNQWKKATVYPSSGSTSAGQVQTTLRFRWGAQQPWCFD